MFRKMARQEKQKGAETDVRRAGHSQREDEEVVELLHAPTSETVGYSTALPLVIYLLACASASPTVRQVYLCPWPWVA